MDRLLKVSVLLIFSFSLNWEFTQGTRTSCKKAKNVTCPEDCDCNYCRVNLKHRQPLIYLFVQCISSVGLSSVPKNIPAETYRLHLRQNKITQLEAGVFSRCKNTRDLFLNGNQLQSRQVHPNAFEGLNALERLDLSDQPGMNFISSDLFKPLTKLRTLRIQRARVEVIAENAFRYNKYLYNIALSENRLKSIPSTLMRNMTHLNRVILHYNSLLTLPSQMFDGSTQITELQLAFCQLRHLSEMVGLQNLTKLKHLHLYGNPFDCGCELRWFRNWIGSVKFIYKINDTKCSSGQTILQFNPDKLQCEFPTVMVACVSVLGFIFLCAVISLLVNYRWKIRYFIFLIHHRVKRYQPIPGNDQLYKYDAFVSHSHKDQDWILQVLRPKLEAPPCNFKLCLDFRDFAVGSLIADNIMNAIEESRKTIFILTQQFIDSEWCYFELEMVRQKMFDEHRDAAILVLKDDIPTKKMPGLLKYFMRNGKYIKWSEHKDGQKLFWKKLETAIKMSKVNMV
ncbi:toll-like receptor 1 [Glandiceps talaboti]